jgi:hypothetical protein
MTFKLVKIMIVKAKGREEQFLIFHDHNIIQHRRVQVHALMRAEADTRLILLVINRKEIALKKKTKKVYRQDC